MSVTSVYNSWKPATGKVVGDGQCVSLIVNNSQAYVESLFPGVSWPSIIGSVVGAKDLPSAFNPQYITWIANNHSDPNQLPVQGDIMVFGPTGPNLPYGNKYDNPYGHVGICDQANPNGFYLAQQNAPSTGQGFNITNYTWQFRPCLGWGHPVVGSAPPAPTPAPAGHTITLPKTTGPWHLYKQGGPYNPSNPANVLGLISPVAFGRDLTYNIVSSHANGVYTIDSQDYGRGDLWTNGSDVVIN